MREVVVAVEGGGGGWWQEGAGKAILSLGGGAHITHEPFCAGKQAAGRQQTCSSRLATIQPASKHPGGSGASAGSKQQARVRVQVRVQAGHATPSGRGWWCGKRLRQICRFLDPCGHSSRASGDGRTQGQSSPSPTALKQGVGVLMRVPTSAARGQAASSK